MRVCLLGASFDTTNLGVSSLAESTVKCILSRWPDAEVTLLGARKESEHRLELFGKEVRVKIAPMRFCVNVFLPNHFCRFFLYALLFKVLKNKKLQKRLARGKPSLSALFEADIVADIAGGDSFSDIYGFWRFARSFMTRWLVVLFNKKLIMLPQTYGPFKHSASKVLAKYILRHASVVYSRDKCGLEYVKSLLNHRRTVKTIEFCPDVGFVLDARKPPNMDIGSLPDVRTDKSVVVGLNISGLLYCGGYTENNMFGLKEDYGNIIRGIIEFFLAKDNVFVLLVPHVFPPAGVIENDVSACREIYTEFSKKYPKRIFMAQGSYDQSQIKYIIGLCDFFLGSRMHSCISALSQFIPAVGIAYSKKFHGVFESVGLQQYVADARSLNKDGVLQTVSAAFENKDQIREHLRNVIPGLTADILNLFRNYK